MELGKKKIKALTSKTRKTIWLFEINFFKHFQFEEQKMMFPKEMNIKIKIWIILLTKIKFLFVIHHH